MLGQSRFPTLLGTIGAMVFGQETTNHDRQANTFRMCNAAYPLERDSLMCNASQLANRLYVQRQFQAAMAAGEFGTAYDIAEIELQKSGHAPNRLMLADVFKLFCQSNPRACVVKNPESLFVSMCKTIPVCLPNGACGIVRGLRLEDGSGRTYLVTLSDDSVEHFVRF
jgi:hypothetical protein